MTVDLRPPYFSPLPPATREGRLGDLIARNRSPLAIIGPGASALDIDPKLIGPETVRFRMNMFFTEPEPRFGKRVDGYFWANDLDVMYELMLSTHSSGRYDYGCFFTPNEIRPEKPENAKVADAVRRNLRPRYDHWWLIAHCPDAVRNMLLRPLPTQAFQALATALVLGFKEIHLVGIDMYRGNGPRYAHDYSKDIKSRLGEKHWTPGYEQGAHSERRDLAFARHLMATFADARIFNASPISPLREVLPDSPLMRKVSIGRAPSTPPPSLRSGEDDAVRWESEAQALRASTSYRLGQMIVRPYYWMTGRAASPQGPSVTPPAKEPVTNGGTAETPSVTKPPVATPAKGAAGPGNDNVVALTTRSAAAAKRSGPLDVLAICHETRSFTGGYRPIKNYITHTRDQGRENELLVTSKNARDKPFAVPEAKATIINSLTPLEWKTIEQLVDRRDNLWIYTHEMGWIFDRIERENPAFFKKVASVLSKTPTLCVSQLQRDYIQRTFNPPRMATIYNVADNGNLDIDECRSRRETDVATVTMVGTIQKRKGVDLFSNVADLAAERGLPLRFQWVGHQTEDGCYLSDKVAWLGNRNAAQLKDIYQTTDCFLLTSFDDPFPLSCIEAMSFGVPIVSYKNSGVCELIGSTHGCGTFVDRDPDVVLPLIERSTDLWVDPQKLFFQARRFVDPAYFAAVVDAAIFDNDTRSKATGDAAASI